ncbi:MAG TPA: YciI family protein [Rhodothermales bacterium]|nr:YciI family protein [Rhodothermales bacterium]
MKDFIYLFRGGEADPENPDTAPSTEELLLWDQWMAPLLAEDRVMGGDPLVPTGRVIRGKNSVISDGPFTEGKEMVGGYFLFKAHDLKEAVALSKNCPILQTADGTVEIREVHQL